MAPASVPVTRRVDWLDAGAQARVAVHLISLVSIRFGRAPSGWDIVPRRAPALE